MIDRDRTEDRHLAERLRHGDKSALAEVYDRYGRLTYSFVLHMLRDTGEAENAVQEVFLRLWKKPNLYRPEQGSLRVWILTIARNAAIDRVRKRAREVSFDGSDMFDRSVSSDALEGLLVKEQVERLRNALTEIPDEQRTAILMNFFGDVSHQEIAQACNEPLGTIKTRIRLGMKKLREALRGFDE